MGAGRLATPLVSVVIVVAAAFCSQAARAENSPALNTCINKIDEDSNGSRWPALIACQKVELSTQDKRLNTLYASLKAASSKQGAEVSAKLLSGQREWISYRNAWCAFEAGHAAPPNDDVNELFCRIELTKSQADRIAEQLDELK